MSHMTRRISPNANRSEQGSAPLLRRCLLGTLLVLGIAGCRADSLVMPSLVECDGTPTCEVPADDVEVKAQAGTALSDARERMVSGIADGAAGAQLGVALHAVSQELAAERPMQARIRLADAYDLLDRLEGSAPAGTIHPDAPEFAAIRLSLVPIARSLGVAIR